MNFRVSLFDPFHLGNILFIGGDCYIIIKTRSYNIINLLNYYAYNKLIINFNLPGNDDIINKMRTLGTN